MEAEWIEKRALLRMLLREHPEWTHTEYAHATRMSVSWIKKWKKRLRRVDEQDLGVLHSRSRARKTRHPPVDRRVVERIVQIREHPPDGLQRVPGALTIKYFLHKDQEMHTLDVWIPRSLRVIWKILHQEGLIPPPFQRRHRPLPQREPLEEVQMDFKDVSEVPLDPHSKQAHVIETLNFVDAGTSILLAAMVRSDFRAETAFDAVVSFLRRYGLPQIFTFDRDPRWVGSQSGRDFPSALCRFLLCLSIQLNICPPRQPQKQPYVERYHRSYKQECLLIHHPVTVQEAIEVTEMFQQHYNWQRPHQGRSCGNQPPRIAYPDLPVLPPLPASVDPDHWIEAIHGRAYTRLVRSNGCVTVDDRLYYLGEVHQGQAVSLLVDAPARQFQVWQGTRLIKYVPIKGIHGAPMPLETFIAWMREQALAEEHKRPLPSLSRGFHQNTLWEEGA
jgi:hypothetical protein